MFTLRFFFRWTDVTQVTSSFNSAKVYTILAMKEVLAQLCFSQHDKKNEIFKKA